MSSAPPRILPALGRALRAVAWLVVFALLATAGAGLASQFAHVPGSPARAELTYTGDAALDAKLDAATQELEGIAAQVDRLAGEAKTALGEIASSDPARLREALQRGGEAAATIDTATNGLRGSLTGLPGDGPTAVIEYSNPTLVRRAAILAAIDAAASLATRWQQVTGRAADAASLISLIDQHDATVLDAASKGVSRQYAEAATILDQALLDVSQVQALRARLIATPEQTVLDEWIERTGGYDAALKILYATLDRSNGEITVAVQSARREERAAFERLPPDRRTIVVIVAEVARGGLTQAVLAIEEAHGRIDQALAEAA